MILTLVIVGVSALDVQAHPVAPVHSQTVAHVAAVKKKAPSHVTAAPKTTPPPAVPAPATTPPKSPSAPATSHIATPSSAKPEPVVVPSPASNVSGLAPVAPITTPSTPSTPSSTQTTTSYTSTNWSGYMATSGSFNAISAAWTATNPTGNGFSTSADSTWIGIGGVSTSDLIQVGTQNIIAANGHVSTSAFYEMLPNVSQTAPGVTVNPGDSMTASLTEISSGQWAISITDTTDNETYSSTVAYTSSNSSAEWIEEDPSFSTGRQIPFDDFGTASFSSGTASLNGNSASLAGNNAQPITMVSRSGQAVATPSVLTSNGASFTVSHN